MASGNTFFELMKKKEQGDATAAAHVNAILAKARELLPQLATEIGKDLTVPEIKLRRGMDRGGGSSNHVSTPETAGVSADVASLVNNILDG